MFHRFFKPKKKFSMENLKYLYGQLVANPVVTEKNKNHLVEVLRNIAELMIWGDQHNPRFFEYFCEVNILSFFLKIMMQRCDTKVKIQVIQTLSILIQNTRSETSVFYLLSNNYINDLIVHRFDFGHEELLAYYISFLKTLSLKLNERTIQFFFNERANDFPLYTEAIKFFKHPESMVRIAVRTLTLNVYNVDYPPLRRFIMDRSAVPYFSNLVWFLRDEVLELHGDIKKCDHAGRARLEEVMEQVIDLFYYLQDIFNLGVESLSQALLDQLLSHFVMPVLIGSLREHDPDAPRAIDARLALFLLSQLFMVFSKFAFINSVATALLDPHPPVIAAALIESPPEYPVVAPVPLTHILFPKSTPAGVPPSPSAMYKRDRYGSPVPMPVGIGPPAIGGGGAAAEEEDGAGVEAEVKVEVVAAGGGGSGGGADEAESPSTPPSEQQQQEQEEEEGDGVAAPVPEAAQAAPEAAVPGADDEMPEDQNLRPRSHVPDIGPVSSPVQQCPNYRDLSAGNPYRERVLALLASDEEQLSFGAVGCLVSLLRNENADTDLLVKAQLCPQRKSRSLRLLSELMSAPSDAIDEEEDAEEKEAPEEEEQAAAAAEEEEEAEEAGKAEAAGQEVAAAAAVGGGENEDGAEEEEEEKKPAAAFIYSPALVSTLLAVLARGSSRMVTTRLVLEFFYELVRDDGATGAWLAPEHMRLVEEAYDASAARFAALFNTSHNLILDTVEDEFNQLNRVVGLKGLVSNTLSLLPLATERSPGVPLEYRQPFTAQERLRREVHTFLHVRRLWFRVRRADDVDFPLRGLLSEVTVRRGDTIPLSSERTVDTTAFVQRTKLRMALVFDERLLVLAVRLPGDPSQGRVELVLPLRHQEAFVDRTNPMVCHISMRSTARPHAACTQIKGTTSKPLWTMTTYYGDRLKCAAAHRHLTERRHALRRDLFHKLVALLPPVPVDETRPPAPAVPPRPHAAAEAAGPDGEAGESADEAKPAAADEAEPAAADEAEPAAADEAEPAAADGAKPAPARRASRPDLRVKTAAEAGETAEAAPKSGADEADDDSRYMSPGLSGPRPSSSRSASDVASAAAAAGAAKADGGASSDSGADTLGEQP